MTGYCPSTSDYPCHHSTNVPYIFIYTLLLPERQMSEPWEHSKMRRFFRSSGTDGQKSTFSELHVSNGLLRRIFVGLSRRRPEFDRGPLHVRSVVENVAFVQVLLLVIRLSALISISPVFHTHSSVTEYAETQRLTSLTIAVAQLIEAMCYKPRGRGFYS